MRRYQKVLWRHEYSDDPVVIYSEIDDDNRETRRVEEYRDGQLEYASSSLGSGTTRIADQPMASLEAMNAKPDFSASSIDAAQFDDVWVRATVKRGTRRSPRSLHRVRTNREPKFHWLRLVITAPPLVVVCYALAELTRSRGRSFSWGTVREWLGGAALVGLGAAMGAFGVWRRKRNPASRP
jgi:hypothetical protein